jgi:hypothetical protein
VSKSIELATPGDLLTAATAKFARNLSLIGAMGQLFEQLAGWPKKFAKKKLALIATARIIEIVGCILHVVLCS